MIVDDEPWNRDIIRAFGQWEQWGMEIVSEADDGAEAIQIIQQLEPHIVITDMRMPGIDGTKLMQYIAEHYSHIQTIVVSGYDDFEYARQALKHNAVEYLLKPIDAAELNDVLVKCKSTIEALRLANSNPMLDIELAYTFHSYRQKMTAIFEQLDQDQLDKLFEQVKVDFGKISNQTVNKKIMDEWILLLKQQIENFSIDIDSVYIQYKPTNMDELLMYVQNQFTDALQALIIQRKYKNKLPIQEVKKYIKAHAFEVIMLEMLASKFYVSKEYLSKFFKQEYGISITDYILQLRMEMAHHHLIESKLSIKEIGELVGYEDISYFYRVFRKHFGIAPGEMRKSLGLK